jgi:ABC-2 type transport system ATP-binding protein
MTSLVTARGVSKRYGKVRAVDDVSFDIEKGRIMGLIGPNGAGKTTLLKALLGLTDCEGDLSVLGLDPFRQRKELMQNICFIADVAVLPRWIRVSQLLDFVESTHPNFSREKAEALLGNTKVNDRRDSRVRELSVCWCSMSRRLASTSSFARSSTQTSCRITSTRSGPSS